MWVSRKEYCEREGITIRAYKKRKVKGLLQWRYGNSGRGGDGGRRIEVYIDDAAPAPEAKRPKVDRMMTPEESGWKPRRGTAKVCPGSIHGRGVTEFVHGEILPSQAPDDKTPNLPAVIAAERPAAAELLPAIVPAPERKISERALKEAHLKYALIDAYQEEARKNHRPKKEIIDSFLASYNTGVILPNIYSELKSVSRSTLYNWLQLYEQGGVDALAPCYGNQSAIKRVTAAEQQFLRQYLLNQNRPKVQDGIRKCKYILGEQSPSSPATLRRYVNWFKEQYHDVWTLEREGQKAWNDKAAPYADRAWWTLKVGEILVGDGHKLNFRVINPHTGKPCRAILIMFWDWYSSYPVGWEVMLTENVQCVATALRNAIIVLGRTPDNVYLDNGKSFRARCFTKGVVLEESEIPGMFGRLGINVIWAMKYNAQAKPVERIFGVLEWLEREIPSYTGANINDKPANLLPNEPRARKLRGDYTPRLEEVNDLIRQWRDFYVVQPLRGRKGKTSQELFDPGRGPGVDPKSLCYLMMRAEVKGVRRGRLTFDGHDYTGDCLYGIKPQKVLVRYSLSDRGQVYVFDTADRFLGVVMPVEATAPRDYEAARRIVSERRRLLKQTKTLANIAKSASPEVLQRAAIKEPVLIDFLQARDEENHPEKASPFIHDDNAPGAVYMPGDPGVSAETPGPGERPYFQTDYEKFSWLMTQPFIEPKDQAWLDELMEQAPLYKEAYRQLKEDS